MKSVRKAAVWIAAALMLVLIPSTAFAAGEAQVAVDCLMAPGGQNVTRIVIDNSDTAPHSYKLSIENSAEGFNAYLTVGGTVTEDLNIPASSSKIVELRIEAPVQPTQENYRFMINCLRDDGQASTTPISVTVNRDYAVEIAAQINKLESLNGNSVSFDIAVKNTGNKELAGLGLTAELPYKWVQDSVVPEKISLKPGENAVFKISVYIPSSQAAGNTEIKISAGNSDIQSQQILIPVTVTANADYALFIIGGVVIVGLITIIYFRRHGRR